MPIVTAVFLLSAHINAGLSYWHIAIAMIAVTANLVAQVYFLRNRASFTALLVAADIGLLTIVGLVTMSVALDVAEGYANTWIRGSGWHFVALGLVACASPFFFSHAWSAKESKIRALFERGRAPSYEVMETISFHSGKLFWWRPSFYGSSSLLMIGSFALARKLGVQETEDIQAYLALLLIVIGYPFLLASIILKWSHYYPVLKKNGDLTIELVTTKRDMTTKGDRLS